MSRAHCGSPHLSLATEFLLSIVGTSFLDHLFCYPLLDCPFTNHSWKGHLLHSQDVTPIPLATLPVVSISRVEGFKCTVHAGNKPLLQSWAVEDCLVCCQLSSTAVKHASHSSVVSCFNGVSAGQHDTHSDSSPKEQHVLFDAGIIQNQ